MRFKKELCEKCYEKRFLTEEDATWGDSDDRRLKRGLVFCTEDDGIILNINESEFKEICKFYLEHIVG